MDTLTEREQQIVALLIEGCRNREIAKEFGTREQTVKNQLTRIFEKTATRSRLELVLLAIRRGYQPGMIRTVPRRAPQAQTA